MFLFVHFNKMKLGLVTYSNVICVRIVDDNNNTWCHDNINKILEELYNALINYKSFTPNNMVLLVEVNKPNIKNPSLTYLKTMFSMLRSKRFKNVIGEKLKCTIVRCDGSGFSTILKIVKYIYTFQRPVESCVNDHIYRHILRECKCMDVYKIIKTM
jgi:hypothetical protein